MVKRKRLFVYGTLAGLSIVAFAVVYLAYLHVPRAQQIHAGIAAVQHGMTEQEVDALMGGRADEEQAGNDLYNRYVRKIWREGDTEGHVGFTNGRVVFTSLLED